MAIHPSAFIDPRADIHPQAEIGPMVVISGAVTIGAGTIVDPFVHILGHTTIGTGCHVHSGAVIGDLPQDRQYTGGESYCRIGDDTIIREGATIHRGTAAGSVTTVGDRCYIMANAHVAHNCTVGDDVTLVNGALLGGYVRVGAKAIVSGNVGIHQFVRIGELAMVGALAKVTQDIPPFMLVGRDGRCEGPNTIGLRRAGFPIAERDAVKTAYRILYRDGLSREDAITFLTKIQHIFVIQRLLDFLDGSSLRGISGGPRLAVGIAACA